MRDSEFIAQLLLLIEERRPRSYSQDDLDEAFSSRDTQWEKLDEVVEEYCAVIKKPNEIVRNDQSGELLRGRLKNQADFYSLVGAIAQMSRENLRLVAEEVTPRLKRFIDIVENDHQRATFIPAEAYFHASRAASNDAGPRQTRINTMVEVLSGRMPLPQGIP